MTTVDQVPGRTARQVAIEAELLRRDLRRYAIEAWPIITGQPLRSNVAIDGVLATLQAIGDGHLRRVLVEVGPGLGKSTALVVYATWRLARVASHRAIHASHSFELSARDSRRARRLVESEWYRVRFPDVRLRHDENTVAHWATTADGRYLAIGVGGGLLGHRAHEVIVDDPLNALDAHSKAARDEVYTWFTEALTTRLDGDGSILVVGQRLGTDDLPGRLREMGAWTVVTLPAEYDARRSCVVLGIDGHELWRDSRTVDGELAAPDVLGREKLDELRATIGSASFEAQYNQDPSSDDTSMCPAR